MEIVTSWMEQRRQQEAQSLILRQLNRRIGAVDAQLQAQIRSLSLSQLETLGKALLDFTTTADLITWLEQHSTNR
jgi:hypothetical protein